ncbi:hypothetical protein F4778DRAFT_472658 [Xylariomycetidae sp. FL2044]|nr:hypothetical protein F4778DRAFT_472658 [Xylariomycetidae sp. FL2044]
MGKETAPKNWSQSIPYLSGPFYAPHLTKPQLLALKTRPPDLTAEIPRTLKPGPSSLVNILPISEPSHPAKGQYGLFAARALPPGSLILPYYGHVHSSSPPYSLAHEKSDYDLWIDRDAGLAVDADRMGNEARFVNDYRGVRARPNAEFVECWDARRSERTMAVFVLPASRKQAVKKAPQGIAKGEEIVVSYGKGFWGNREHEVHIEDESHHAEPR